MPFIVNGELRIVRVWEVNSPTGGGLLVFEELNGALWQLCEAGLGSSQLKHIEDDWVEHPAVQQYLPANITPRPSDAKPWNYEFALTCGAILWVRPGRYLNTFRWGIRTQWNLLDRTSDRL